MPVAEAPVHKMGHRCQQEAVFWCTLLSVGFQSRLNACAQMSDYMLVDVQCEMFLACVLVEHDRQLSSHASGMSRLLCCGNAHSSQVAQDLVDRGCRDEWLVSAQQLQ